jgi:predicted nucleic acid-binding protein
MSDKVPMNNGIVVNASPLITLFKAGLSSVLPKLSQRIVVPESVWQEISVCKDAAFRGLSAAVWAARKKVETDKRVLVWNLGKGESQVISWALKSSDYIAVIDDRAARKCCESLNIRHVGTIGLLVSAHRFGLIPSLRIALLQVRNAGLYIGDDLFDSLIAGEM